MNTRVDPSDYIYVDSWERLCRDLSGMIIYRGTEGAPAIFRDLKGSGYKTILVSGYCDYGVVEQERHHPNADLARLAAATNWAHAATIREGYARCPVGPACVLEKCNIKHRWSLKTDRYTWETFDEIPNEVAKWYTTNLNMFHHKVELIPFGLNNDGPGSGMIPDLVGRPKTGLLYVNFQDNTLDRILLKQRYADQSWLTFRPQANLPVGQYLEEIASHKFVLCPPGCGLDCYRIWECIYLGSWPILEKSIFANLLVEMGLPVVVTDDLFKINPDDLKRVEQQLLDKPFDLSRAKLSYWKERLLSEANAL